MGKFYFKFDKIINKVCEILEQTLKTGIFVNSFMNHNIKKKLRPKKLLTIKLFEKNNLSVKKKLKSLGKIAKKFLSKPE